MNLGSHPDVGRFLDSVCDCVRARQLHPELREELTVHLDALVQEGLAEGLSEQEAIEGAIARMGEPRQIGSQLDYTHRPRTDWVMIILIFLLTGIGLLGMYNIQSKGTDWLSYVDFFDNKLLHIGIGIVLMAVLWRVDYQRLHKASEYLFGAGVLLLIGVNVAGTWVNGQTAWYFLGGYGFYVPTVAILLMIIGCSGVKPLRELGLKASILHIGYRGVLPLYLFMQINVNTMAAVYAMLFVLYLWLTKRSIWQVLAYVAGVALASLYAVSYSGYLYSRVFGFLNRTGDPQGGNYMLVSSAEAMQSAGWWGRGELPNQIPYLQSEGFLPGFIYTFGWAAGAVVLSLIVAFVVKIVITSTLIKDRYGKLIFANIAALFALEYGWALAMIFGYAPFVGISLPLLSYGGTDLVFQFAALGLLLGIYRRRNMVRTSRYSTLES